LLIYLKLAVKPFFFCKRKNPWEKRKADRKPLGKEKQIENPWEKR